MKTLNTYLKRWLFPNIAFNNTALIANTIPTSIKITKLFANDAKSKSLAEFMTFISRANKVNATNIAETISIIFPIGKSFLYSRYISFFSDSFYILFISLVTNNNRQKNHIYYFRRYYIPINRYNKKWISGNCQYARSSVALIYFLKFLFFFFFYILLTHYRVIYFTKKYSSSQVILQKESCRNSFAFLQGIYRMFFDLNFFRCFYFISYGRGLLNFAFLHKINYFFKDLYLLFLNLDNKLKLKFKTQSQNHCFLGGGEVIY